MPRKKKQKEGYHLKFIPSGRFDELKELAEKNEYFKNKTICLAKYIEAFSNTVERSWNTEKEFVGISQRILRERLCCDNKEVSKILKDLVEVKMLEIDKSTFEAAVSAWSYKPLYSSLEIVIINRNMISKVTDQMLSENVSLKCKKLQKYFSVVSKIKLEDTVINYMNNVITRGNIDGDVFVPGCTLPRLTGDNCDTSVPIKALGKIPTEFIPVYKLLAGKFRISRPNKNSRVYTNITNLARQYRKFLRLNGQPLKGIDISNSQPLIATILFRWYSELAYNEVKQDVIEYQASCESGKFYEYFMELNGIDTSDAEKRTWFKKEFFGKVFFTKEVEKENYLKTQFKEKYPTCFEAIFNVKGGMYSNKYNKFAIHMQEIETQIIFETNIKLIDMGYDVVNIFDSLYSDSDEAIKLAEQFMRDEFKQFNIHPNFKKEDYTKHDD